LVKFEAHRVTESGRTAGKRSLRLRRRRDADGDSDQDAEPVVGDTSGLDDVSGWATAGAEVATEVAGQFGGVAAEKIEGGLQSLKGAVLDPVGTIGGVADGAGQAIEDVATVFEPPTANPDAQGLADVHRPESEQNLLPYQMQQVTPPPAPFNGVFCRGAACQYRRQISTTFGPGMAAIGTLVVPELCRGLSCPSRPRAPDFITNCTHYFRGVGEGIPGSEASWTIAAVRDTFVSTCEVAFPLEATSCPAYGQVMVGALADTVGQKFIGGGYETICGHLENFVVQLSQAEIHLGLVAVPEAAGSAALVQQPPAVYEVVPQAEAAVPQPPRRAGPCTPSGRRWRAWWLKNHGAPRRPAALLQRRGGGRGDEEADPACERRPQIVAPQHTMYEIAPGSPDGAVPPSEVRGDLFTQCRDQLEEVSLGVPQQAPMLIQMTREWCETQGLFPAPDDANGLAPHPDWDMHTCTEIGQLLTLAFRQELAAETPLSSIEACKRIFVSAGLVHRVDRIMRESWTISGRSIGKGAAGDEPNLDPRQMELAKAAALKAQKVRDRLLRTQEAKAAVAQAKEDVVAWDGSASLQTAMPSTTKPALPSAASFPY